MASLTLQYKKPRGQSSGWGSWQSISGVDYCSYGNNAHVVYRAYLDLTGSSKMTACQVNTNFVCRTSGASHAATLYCFLYTSDPTSSSPTTPPGGYVSSAQYSATVPYYGVNQYFYFTNLNITQSGYVYFWFTDLNNSSYADDLYSYDTGNGYLGTPSCSGTFTKAQRTLSVSPSSVATGSAVTVSIGNADSSETIRFYYGSTLLSAQAISNGYASITCPKSWFTTAGVSTLTSMTVSVTVDSDSSLSASFTLTAGDNMKPTVGTPTATIVQSGRAATNFPNTYIANISKSKIAATVTAGSNAAIRTVKLTFPGGTTVNMSYNSSTGKYEGTTAAPITGNTTFTVTATDARGFTGSNTVSITGVVSYNLPSVSIDEANTYRCNSSGTETGGGLYVKVKANASYYSSLSGNSLDKFRFYIKEDHDAGYTDYQNLTSGVQSAAFAMHVPGENDYVTVVVVIQDKISEEITKSIRLKGKTRNFVAKRSASGTYFGVGLSPSRDSGGSSIELPDDGDFLLGGMPAQTFALPVNDLLDGSTFGKDFLNINRSDRRAEENAATFFYRPQASLAQWANGPATNDSYNWRGYRMVLIYNSSFAMVIVFEFYPYPGRIWSNFYNGSYEWTGWRYTQASTPSS